MASPDFNVTAIPSLENNYGALMLGTFGGLMIYGLTVHQGYQYMCLSRHKTESSYIKAMVYFVLLMETIHSVLSMHVCYYSFVINYCRPDVLFEGSGSWSINLLPVFTGIIIAVSQSFLAYRLFKFNPRYGPIAVFVVILILGELGLSTALTVEFFAKPGLSHFQRFNLRMTSVALGMVIITDTALTLLLTITLRRCRTGFTSTDSKINVLIVYTINTGLLTGTISAISFFMTLFYPHTLISDALAMVASKLYANSVLAILNSRQFLSNGDENGLKMNSYEMASPSCSHPTKSENDSLGTSQHILQIRVARDNCGDE